MKYLFLKFFLSLIFFFLPFLVFADIRIVSIFPNTVDDTNLEYIDIRNTGCSSIDIGSYSLEDASGKEYIFPSSTTIESKANFRISRIDSKIILNNTDETIFIKNGSGTLLDTYSYVNSTKGVVIDVAWTDETCQDNSGTGGQSNTGSIDTSSGSQNTGTGNNQNTSSGTQNTSGSGGENTGNNGNQNFSSGSDNSTGSQNNNTGSSFTGKLLAKNLGYLDNDFDGYIDTIFLDYGETLSGSLNKENIALYSNTGGLYANRINTETGRIQESSISGSLIFLRIFPATEKKSLLKINNTPTSELRLKSSGNLGVTSIFRQELDTLFLTSSFGEYKNIIHPNDVVTNTGTIHSGSTNTGDTSSGNTNSGLNIPFPEMHFTFQNYTNTTFSGNIFICSMSPCRLNFTLEPIFTGSFLEKDYTCRIEYAGNMYETCNPPQLYPISSSTGMMIQILRKSDAKVFNWNYSFTFESMQTHGGNQANELLIKTDITPPVIVLDMDGKWREYYEQIGDYEINCYTETCSINLTAERSYDSEGGKVRFIWMYDMANLSESKDPGERKFGLGDHDIWLRVIDDVGNWSQVHYRIHVLGKKEKIVPEEKKKLKTTHTSTKLVSATKNRGKKKAKKKIASQVYFFDPPTIKIQDKNTEYASGVYICRTTKKTCSVNLTLLDTIKGVTYTWDYPNGKRYVTKNPRSIQFLPGVSSFTLSASYGTGTPFWSKTVFINVIKSEKSKRKIIKDMKKGPKKKTESKKNIDPTKEGVIQARVFFPFFSGIGFLLLIPRMNKRRKM